ncbi:MAG: thiamine pyrophosphate-dependent enzyme [Chitinophagales bacterium]
MKQNITYQKGDASNFHLVELYRNLLKPRMIEEKMLILLRQGKISKWFAGIGQEAIAVGATMAMESDEIIFPMHRNLGVFTTRKVPLEKLFAQWQGKELGFTKGRDRSFHFGTLDYSIVGMISHLGPQLSLASGVALAHKLRQENKISLAFTGEGGTSEGEFHEALNVAAVWQLPVIFLIENNGYGLSTPTSEQYRCEHLADRGIGYGMQSYRIDGNNVLEMYNTINTVAEEIRQNPEPILIECETFRRRGHEEASGTKYVPEELMEFWEQKDPVTNYEQFLLKEGIITFEQIEDWKEQITNEINEALEIADNAPYPQANAQREVDDLFQPHLQKVIAPKNNSTKEIRFIDAISEGLDEAMQQYDELVLMGQDIADYGGVFKITQGFVEKYGKERVRNTPICESAIVGIGLGLSFKGMKSMIEMQFSDFVTCAFNQIVNNIAKTHYRWGTNADVVIRMPCGGTVGAGPFHSQTNEAWFFKTPGLKIVYPSSAEDAKGLLLASFEDPNPVLFFEHKAMYRSISGNVPEGYYTTEIGKAKLIVTDHSLKASDSKHELQARASILKARASAIIITYGLGVHWAKQLVEAKKLNVAILDLRTLAPLDYAAIDDIVKQTHRVLILHEDTLLGGIGAEISAYITEHLFEYLDAPVIRVASLDTPYPFVKNLEDDFLPIKRLEEQLIKLLAY